MDSGINHFGACAVAVCMHQRGTSLNSKLHSSTFNNIRIYAVVNFLITNLETSKVMTSLYVLTESLPWISRSLDAVSSLTLIRVRHLSRWRIASRLQRRYSSSLLRFCSAGSTTVRGLPTFFSMKKRRWTLKFTMANKILEHRRRYSDSWNSVRYSKIILYTISRLHAVRIISWARDAATRIRTLYAAS